LKVMLTEDLSPLGAMGAVVDVARGYARNYLIPQGKAMDATPGNLARVEKAKARYLQSQASAREAALVQVAHLQGVGVTIAQRVGEEERLYGSVTVGMIVEALADKKANRIFFACTHPVLSGPALANIAGSKLERLFVTNTIPLTEEAAHTGRFSVQSVAELFGEAIRRINEGSSVSSLFT